MLFTRLPILALASLAAAQDSSSSSSSSGNSSQSLNSTAGSNPSLSNFTALLGSDPALLETLIRAQNITVLAPSNEALSAFTNTTEGRMIANNTGLMSALLRYHVLNGTFQASQITNQSAFIPTLLSNETYANVTGGQVVEAVKIGNKTVFYSGLLQNSTVVTADQNFTAGTIHIIDRVLTIPPAFLISALDLGLTSLYGAVNVSQTINQADVSNVTVFAPDNAAFRYIGSAFSNLTSEDLKGILDYHIVRNVYYSTDLHNGTKIVTDDGQRNLSISTGANGTVFVNAAKVIVPNVLIANGVMHIVDNVLNPNSTSSPSASATAGAPAFSGSSASDQPFTSGQPTATTTINPTTNGAGAAASTAAGSASKSKGLAAPRCTGAVEYAALAGAGAVAIAWGL